MVRDSVLITPGITSDLLEGINRRTVLELARDMGIRVEERNIDLTELYVADEIFASGTSAFIAPIKEIDASVIGGGAIGVITTKIRQMHNVVMHGEEVKYMRYLIVI